MHKDREEQIIRHIQGATVTHESPFSALHVPSEMDTISAEECEKFVIPFYRVSFRSLEPDVLQALKDIYPDVTSSVIDRLLTDYNWRPRLVGAFFAALKQFIAFEDRLGRLLVRSDLCFAGKIYCVALAEFNTLTGLDYLEEYLKYYLKRFDLDFDQGDAIGAIAYLDSINGTKHLQRFLPLWDEYANTKSWKPDLQPQIDWFAEEMKALHQCRKAVTAI